MTFESFLKSIYNLVYTNMHKFIEVDYTVIYSLGFLLILAWAIVILISKSFSYTTMISKDCSKIAGFIKKHKQINNENLVLFNKKCFGRHCVKSLKNGWYAFLNEQYGFPSEYILYEQCLTRHRVGRGISRSRILAFRYGSAFISLAAIGYCLHYINNFSQPIRIIPGMALLAITAMICDLIINGVFSLADNGAVENFYRMQERLDAYVNLQPAMKVSIDKPQESISESKNMIGSPIIEETATVNYADAAVGEPAIEMKAEAPQKEETVEKPAMQSQLKIDKIIKLVDFAIAKNSNPDTYRKLAKMLLECAAGMENGEDRTKLKECAVKIKTKLDGIN